MTDDDELDEALDLVHKEARTAPAPLDRARAALLDELDKIDDSEASGGSVTEFRPRRTRRFASPVAAAVAAVLAITAVAVWSNSGDDPRGTEMAAPQRAEVPRSARQVLEAAADLRAKVTEPPLGPDRYRYFSKDHWQEFSTGPNAWGNTAGAPLKGWTYLLGERWQQWIPADPEQDWLERRQSSGKPKLLGGTMPAAEVPPPPPVNADPDERRAPCGHYYANTRDNPCGAPEDTSNPVFYANLPRDPAELYAIMTKRAKTEDLVFEFGVLTLQSGLMPADLRPSWYRALAKIPGLEVTDPRRGSTAGPVWRSVRAASSSVANWSSTPSPARSSAIAWSPDRGRSTPGSNRAPCSGTPP